MMGITQSITSRKSVSFGNAFLFRDTLFQDSARGDYKPLDITYGEIGIFHGTLCRHHVPMNTSDFTRVSMDFRIGLGETWLIDGFALKHGSRGFLHIF